MPKPPFSKPRLRQVPRPKLPPKPAPKPPPLVAKGKAKPKPPLHGRSVQLNHGAPVGYVKAMPRLAGPEDATPTGPTLFAVIGTWHEADVIEATVKSCFANGCTRVFVVDNASPDGTQDAARHAGAEIARVYETPFYDDDLRVRLMNEVMAEVTAREKAAYLWWLALDADEFPCGPHGERVIDYIKTLPGGVNCVGGAAIDLYPTVEPYYTPGTHPADCMAQGLRRLGGRDVFCSEGHWKHPLLRQDHGVYGLAQSRGLHIPFVQGVVPVEPKDPLVVFHAPYRAKEATYRRLEALCGKRPEHGGLHRSAGDDGIIQGNGAIKRYRSLDHVYAGRWDQVELPHSQIYGDDVVGIALFAWKRLVPGLRRIPRWYTHPDDQPAAKLELPVVG